MVHDTKRYEDMITSQLDDYETCLAVRRKELTTSLPHGPARHRAVLSELELKAAEVKTRIRRLRSALPDETRKAKAEVEAAWSQFKQAYEDAGI